MCRVEVHNHHFPNFVLRSANYRFELTTPLCKFPIQPRLSVDRTIRELQTFHDTVRPKTARVEQLQKAVSGPLQS